MPTCFVIQPFDKGQYDKRYRDVLAPAIVDAGLEPYRVDEDLSVTVPIDTIENRIREAEGCLADITTNNPNVWYEVGFAMANGKPVVLICADPRPEPYPFDVRHRLIISYTPQSTSDFEKLKKDVTTSIKAKAQRAEELQTVAVLSQVAPFEGDLLPHEVAVLITIMSVVSTPDEGVLPQKVKDSMKRSGYTAMASTLALAGLERKEMVEYVTGEDDFGHTFPLCHITRKGIDWMLENDDRFRLKIAEEEPASEPDEPNRTEPTLTDDEIPF